MASEQNGPRKIDVHIALMRPILLMGCEREPLLFSAILAVTMVFVLANIVFAIIGVAFWVLTVAVLQRMAKADHQMTQVYVRHVKYKTYYPAQSSVFAINPNIKQQQ